MNKSAAHNSTPSVSGEGKRQSDQAMYQRSLFLRMALNMSWKLAIVVLVPVVGGAKLDAHFGTTHLWTFIGLGVAFVASAAVMWWSARLAARIPVPKLSAAQKRAIQKSYEEDDEDEV